MNKIIYKRHLLLLILTIIIVLAVLFFKREQISLLFVSYNSTNYIENNNFSKIFKKLFYEKEFTEIVFKDNKNIDPSIEIYNFKSGEPPKLKTTFIILDIDEIEIVKSTVDRYYNYIVKSEINENYSETGIKAKILLKKSKHSVVSLDSQNLFIESLLNIRNSLCNAGIDIFKAEIIRNVAHRYLLSEYCRNFLTIISSSKYKSKYNILIIEEPHYNIDQQINLYKGLQVFFRENTSLQKKIIFLSEGTEYNKVIDIYRLTNKYPHPSEDLIFQSLKSYLITGYIAFCWKNNVKIETIGYEDPIIYNLSARTWSYMESQPNLPFEKKEFLSKVWFYTVTARNTSAVTAIKSVVEQNKIPILFIGGRHLVKENDSIIKEVKNSSGIDDLMTTKEWDYLNSFENNGIHDLLEKQGIGYTLLIAKENPFRQFDSDTQNTQKYAELMQLQQNRLSLKNNKKQTSINQKNLNVTVSVSINDLLMMLQTISDNGDKNIDKNNNNKNGNDNGKENKKPSSGGRGSGKPPNNGGNSVIFYDDGSGDKPEDSGFWNKLKKILKDLLKNKKINSLSDLIGFLDNIKILKNKSLQAIQATIKGNIVKIFNDLAKHYNAKVEKDEKNNPYFWIGNKEIRVGTHKSKSGSTIDINAGGSTIKIRVIN